MNWEEYNRMTQVRYTSTGTRILHHPEALESLRAKQNHPVTLHIMPTEKCNLRCSFCSVAERKQFPELPWEQVMYVVNALEARGLKGVILSGGGEPLMYSNIYHLLGYLCDKFSVGVITNGTLLRFMDPLLLNRLTWVRVSMNTLDYVDTISLPEFSGRAALGFSYIWHAQSKLTTLNKIAEIAKECKVKYIRLVPDCTVPTEQLEAAHVELHQLAERLGPPWFHQYKIHKQPAECHLGRVHPVLYTDGMIYPCDSLVLNSPVYDRRFREQFALCRWDEIGGFFDRPIEGSLLDTAMCPHCIFTPQNDLLTNVISNKPLPEPPCEIIHTNFV